MSQRFAQTLIQVQQQAMASSAKAEPQMSQWMQSFFHNRPAFAYSVGINTPEGCLTIGNGSQSYANAVLLPAVAVPAMLSAIAIPNFVKARATSQANACINNLRQIDAAKQEWALGKRQTIHRCAHDGRFETLSCGKFPIARPAAPIPSMRLASRPSAAFPTTSCLKYQAGRTPGVVECC